MKSEKFCLLGYSFEELWWEIHKLKPAEKIVILGSIKSDKEMSITFHLAKKVLGILLNFESYFSEKHKILCLFQKIIYPII